MKSPSTEIPERVKPLPCPFCKSPNAGIAFGGWHPQDICIKCSNCSSIGPTYNVQKEFDEYDAYSEYQHTIVYNKATEAWNAYHTKDKLPEGYR